MVIGYKNQAKKAEPICFNQCYKIENKSKNNIIMKTNFRFGEVLKFNEVVEYNSERVEFRPVFETTKGGVSLIAMKAGQKLDTHTAPFEVMVTVCEGEIEFTMLDQSRILRAGEFLLKGANVPHSVVANIDSKLMLVKIKDDPHNTDI